MPQWLSTVFPLIRDAQKCFWLIACHSSSKANKQRKQVQVEKSFYSTDQQTFLALWDPHRWGYFHSAGSREQTCVGRLIYSSRIHKMLLSCLPALCCSHLTSSLEGWNFITVMNLCFSFPAPGGFKHACAKLLSPCPAVYNLGYTKVDFTWELERREEIYHKAFSTLVTSASVNTVYQQR